MLDKREIKFIAEELTKRGVLFESVENVLETDIDTIIKICVDAEEEEMEKSALWELDENGEMYESKVADEDYNPVRLNFAEDVYLKLSKLHGKL